ncbi:MAG: hypothetical protein CML42_09560 [Rhodobacteraceae bacterium]|nr:hypothetical protein [Paracoccaceae bacterium]|tara:strand:+ start:12378 stop:13130 length:753 start_codon:yes stop_codon:yes gene_type:complete
MAYKIGIIIPTTTTGRNWKDVKETYLYNIFMKSFLNTYNKEYNYTIYLGIDDNDKLFSKENEKSVIKNFENIMPTVSIEFVSMNGIEKGWVTKMWNRLFKKAYDDNCDYFYQCGDDITFINIDWTKQSISNLRNHNNVGLTGPLDYGRIRTNPRSCLPGGERFIQTQTFVSRKHMETFGFFFPPEIKNWFCDDWITKVYYPDFFYPMRNKFIINQGGNPRYNPSGSLYPNDPVKKLCEELINKHKLLLTK